MEQPVATPAFNPNPFWHFSSTAESLGSFGLTEIGAVLKDVTLIFKAFDTHLALKIQHVREPLRSWKFTQDMHLNDLYIYICIYDLYWFIDLPLENGDLWL